MKKNTPTTERFNPVSPDLLTKQYKHVFDQLPGNALAGEKAPVNVFGQLLRSPDVAEVFIPYWVATKARLNLSVREQEFIIMRMAYRYRCEYVWGHHVPVILEAGVSENDILELLKPLAEMELPENEVALLLATDELVEKANLSQQTWDRLKSYYDDGQVLDLITVVSQYVLFCSVNNVFGIRLENDSMPPLGQVK